MDTAVTLMKIEIIDDFLSPYYTDSLVKTFGGKKDGRGLFPWYFTNNLNTVERLGNYYFNHLLIVDYKVENPEWLPIFEPLVNRIGISVNNIWRLKANLYPRTQRRIHHVSHYDYEPDSGLRTVLYYVNDNNGFTVFDGKRKIRSKRNRAIVFDGSNKHHSTTPTNSNWRCSINIDYKL